MSIDRVYIFTTLPRAADRALVCWGGLLAKETPYEKIEIFDGPDHEAYPSKAAIIEAAAAEGFHFNATGNAFGLSHAGIAQNWAYCQLYTQIRERNETALILHDDNWLRFSFYRYEILIDQLSDFVVMFLGGNIRVSDWQHFPNEAPLVLQGVPFEFSDQCLIATPAFADWLLEAFPHQSESKSFEGYIRYEKIGKQEIPEGFYTIPGDLGTADFPPDAIPSIMHDRDLYKQGILQTIRKNSDE